MDDIDSDINRARIGRRDEQLIGWDNIRKKDGLEPNLPPLTVIKKFTPPSRICDTCAYYGYWSQKHGVIRVFCKKKNHLITKFTTSDCLNWKSNDSDSLLK
ncbi:MULTISPECIES: hypothetical protein [unclassified Methanoregula]|uniref:hypothetical protein n=1 Tax=unclassified Methanoregula TaxID=2649730 RepID=UPI0025B7E66A|nr:MULTISPECIES: hypothetical protein [unclassified Methanoregula]